MSQTTIRIPAPLRSLTGGASEVAVEAATVGEALQALGAQHDGLTERILDGSGELRAFVNLYLGDSNVRSLDGLSTAIEGDTVLHIVPAVAGGTR